MRKQNGGAMKQWVKPTVEVASMNEAQAGSNSQSIDGVFPASMGQHVPNS